MAFWRTRLKADWVIRARNFEMPKRVAMKSKFRLPAKTQEQNHIRHLCRTSLYLNLHLMRLTHIPNRDIDPQQPTLKSRLERLYIDVMR